MQTRSYTNWTKALFYEELNFSSVILSLPHKHGAVIDVSLALVWLTICYSWLTITNMLSTFRNKSWWTLRELLFCFVNKLFSCVSPTPVWSSEYWEHDEDPLYLPEVGVWSSIPSTFMYAAIRHRLHKLLRKGASRWVECVGPHMMPMWLGELEEESESKLIKRQKLDIYHDTGPIMFDGSHTVTTGVSTLWRKWTNHDGLIHEFEPGFAS